MKGIDTLNKRGILIGGLVAGLIVNLGEIILNAAILGSDWAAARENLGLPAQEGSGAIVVYAIMGFIIGFALVKLYAFIRPRFGPGPKTALIAGYFVWFLVYVFPAIFYTVTPIFPTRMVWIGVVWGGFELMIAALVGASLYSEDEA